MRDRLTLVQNKGKTLADVIRAGLGLIEPEIRAEETVREEAYEDGFHKGYSKALKVYAVTYPCAECGEPITVTSETEKDQISDYMHAQGWAHKDCDD